MEAMRRGRESCRRSGLRPPSALRRVQPFDVGGQGVDASGNLLYENHELADDDGDDIETLEAVWNNIPCEEPSADESDDESDTSYNSDDDDNTSDEDDELSDASESSLLET